MPHFFITESQIKNDLIIINDTDNYRHIAKSLRARIGEKLLLIDGNQTQYETTITEIDNKTIQCNINKKYHSKRYLEFNLYLAQSPLRSDAQITIIEKATELGVSGVYPVITDNCALSKNILEKKREKWQRTMIEASKQCERANIPTCFDLTTLEQVLSSEKYDKILVLAERSTEISLKKYLRENKIKKGEKVLAIIGPEGGFSQKEFDFFREQSLPLISLGDLILKAETAVIVTLGSIIYESQN